MSEPLQWLAQALCRFAAGHPDAAPFLALWPEPEAPERPVVPRGLPVLGAICELTAPCDPAAAALLPLIAEHAPSLAWHQTYREADVGRGFLDRYGWTEIVGQRGPWPSSTLAAGLLLLGTDTLYPPHSHAAEEVYLPIAGTARWLKNDGWTRHAPGCVIHHPPHVVHATRTEAEPLVALYLWRGDGLTESARLV